MFGEFDIDLWDQDADPHTMNNIHIAFNMLSSDGIRDHAAFWLQSKLAELTSDKKSTTSFDEKPSDADRAQSREEWKKFIVRRKRIPTRAIF